LSRKIFGKRVDLEGNLNLLKYPRVTIVGSRRPNSYTKIITQALARALVKKGYVVVSGGALGVDALAHIGATPSKTIAVLPSGIDINYPKTNASLLQEIREKGLVISPFERGFKPRRWSFVVRNELMVELGEFLIVTQADLKSGSMRSVKFALKKGKEVYTIPHRIGESEGTNYLLKENLAKPIWSVEEFTQVEKEEEDPFIEYLKTSPFYDEAVAKFKDRIFEAELEGVIQVREGRVFYQGD